MSPSSSHSPTLTRAVAAAAFAAAAAVVNVAATPAIDLADPAATLAAAKGVSRWMTTYFTFSTWNDFWGAWDMNIVQWHESGIYFNTILDYMHYSGDYTMSSFVNTAMTKAMNDRGDFLFGCEGNCGGKWNDDIGWWGLAALTGSELYGTKDTDTIASPDGTVRPSWLHVGNFTLFRILEQVDDRCGGGAYWSRDRNANEANLRLGKTAITNVQVVWFAIRLYHATRAPAYLDIARTFWDWIVTVLTDRDTYLIHDAVYTDDKCTKDANSWSYLYTPMAMAGVALSNATGNPSFLTDGLRYFAYWKATFIDPSTGRFREPLCGSSPRFVCKDPTGFNFPVYETLADMYRLLPDARADVREEIRSVMVAQGRRLLAADPCTDDWNCVRTMNPVPKQYTFPNGTNPRDQIEVLSFLNGMVRINGFAPPAKRPDNNAVVGTRPKSAAIRGVRVARSLGGCVFAVALGVLVPA
ncbi:glycosyl hydrolase family 76-domain-containing protein [Zopfochytrium polystomum]|nr:glycosyl hydrolase family 76-domain-containing protein [Zopfochytrium polystomum]